MEADVVRWAYFAFAAAAIAVLGARGLAHWVEWQPWSVRYVGIGAAVVGSVLVWNTLGIGTMIKVVLIAGVIIAIYIWQDVGLEKRENEEQAEKQEKLLRKF